MKGILATLVRGNLASLGTLGSLLALVALLVVPMMSVDGSAVDSSPTKADAAATNIPAETPDGKKRYHSHLEDVFGPDSLTKATGDAGDRFACGVVVRKAS